MHVCDLLPEFVASQVTLILFIHVNYMKLTSLIPVRCTFVPWRIRLLLHITQHFQNYKIAPHVVLLQCEV